MKLLITFFACAFNIYSLLFFISDTEKITDILGKMNLKAKIYSVSAIFLVAVSVMLSRVYLVFWLVFEYLGIIWWYGRQKRDHLRNVQRGLLCLVTVIVTELTIIYLYYYKGIENLESTGRINYEIQIACYLAMALAEYFLIIFREIRKTTRGYRRTLMITLAAKGIGDIVWLYICIGTCAFKNNYILLSVLFIAEIIIDYYAFCLMVLKIAERSEQDKRADMHMNAYEYYLNMEEEHLQIRKMYHEMKNQLMIMGSEEAEQGEGKPEYRQLMEEKLESINQFYHTGSKSLDMLLFDGKMKAKARNIEFDAVVSEGCLSFMDEEDIGIIFRNTSWTMRCREPVW